MKIALVSLEQVWEDKKTNLILCEEYIHKASTKNVDLIIFPEMTLTGFSNAIEKNAEDEKGSRTIGNFIQLSKKFNIAILFGLIIKFNNKAENRAIFITKNGKNIGSYSKIHPFSLVGEDKYFKSGSNLCVVKFENIRIGLTICYDLRFPELYSGLARQCDVIVNIANWPKKRVEHWNTLLKARAIENQLFVAGINRIGIDNNNLEYEESSNIYNANGDTEKFDIFQDMKIYTIDKEFTKEFKNKFNTTDDRKVEFYKGIL